MRLYNDNGEGVGGSPLDDDDDEDDEEDDEGPMIPPLAGCDDNESWEIEWGFAGSLQRRAIRSRFQSIPSFKGFHEPEPDSSTVLIMTGGLTGRLDHRRHCLIHAAEECDIGRDVSISVESLSRLFTLLSKPTSLGVHHTRGWTRGDCATATIARSN